VDATCPTVERHRWSSSSISASKPGPHARPCRIAIRGPWSPRTRSAYLYRTGGPAGSPQTRRRGGLV